MFGDFQRYQWALISQKLNLIHISHTIFGNSSNNVKVIDTNSNPENKTEDLERLIQCLPSMYEAMGVILSTVVGIKVSGIQGHHLMRNKFDFSFC